MMVFESTVMALAVVLVLFLVVFLLRKTIISLSTPGQSFNWWSLLFYRQLLLVLITPFFLSLLGVDAFDSYSKWITDEYAIRMSWIVLYTVVFFTLSFSFSLRLFNLGRTQCGCEVDNDILKRSRRFAFFTFIVGAAILFVGLVFFTHKHALLSALLHGANIRETRGFNSFSSTLPSIVAMFISICAWIPAIHSGYEAKNKKYLYAFLFLIAALLLSGVRGDKAPILETFILFGISFAMASKNNFSFKNIIKVLAGMLFMFFLLFEVARLQFSDMDMPAFLAYLLERLGVAQMAGVYLGINYMDNLTTQLPSDFWMNIFPLSNQILGEHQKVAKYIMLEISGLDHDETGVMNSLFISEAFGIGGWFLLFISPLIVGFSMALSFKIIYIYFSKLFSASVASLYYIPFGFLAMNLTGDFAQFPMQRALFISLPVFLVVWFLCFFYNFSVSNRRVY